MNQTNNSNQQSFDFNNKSYKTIKEFRNAQTRFRKKLLKSLQGKTSRDDIKRLLATNFQLQIEKNQMKKRYAMLAKQRRDNSKLGLANYIDVPTTKKSHTERFHMREEQVKEYRKNVENINFRTNNITLKKNALSGRITEDFIDNHLDDISERDDIITNKIMIDLRQAQNNGFRLLCDLTLRVIMTDKEGNDVERYARSSASYINTITDIGILIENLNNSYESVLEQAKNTSNLIFKQYKNISIHSIRQKRAEIKAGNYIEESQEIKNSKSIINIKNYDEKCLEYCIINYTYYNELKNTKGVKKFNKYFKYLKIPTDQQYPINIDEDVSKYEVLNDIKIQIYVIKSKQFIPFYKSKFQSKEKRVIDLLLLEDPENEDNKHLCWIKNKSRLENHLQVKNKKNKMYKCDNCEQYENRSQQMLDKHMEICLKNEKSFIKLPQIKKVKGVADVIPTMSFRNHQNEFEHPFSCFVDFESTLKKIDRRDDQDKRVENASTQYYQKHIPNSFGLKYNCIVDDIYSEPYQSFVNEDEKILCESFVLELERLAKKCYDITQTFKTDIMWENEQEEEHKNNKECENCNCKYDKKNYKVAHHDHITGQFIGSYCNTCNLKFKYKKFLPVYIHNLKGYDAHLFIKSLYNYGCQEKQISCIPNNEEQYISFSKTIKVDEYYDKKDKEVKPIMYEIRFVDSFAILSGSLDSLVSNVRAQNTDITTLRSLFVNTSEAFPNDDDFLKMTEKGVYPYEYIDDFSKLFEYQLPKKKEFYSKLNDSNISTEDYNRAISVYKHFNCKSILDYHELYLKADVLLLSDVWYNFKKVCLTNYKLDPTYYYSAPSLAWDSFLKKSEIELELITDYEKYMFIEDGNRGGLSQISTRFSKANNTYIKNYDKKKDDSYISYFDANNLYGHSMCEYLPYADFEWNTDEWTNEKILQLEDKGDTGYLFNVDLHIPEKLHDHFNNYTPLPVNRAVKESDLSISQLNNFKETNGVDYKESKIKKLCCSLEDRIDYKVNYRMLKFALNSGFELLKVNKVLQYKQKPFMKPYIMMNTKLRTECKSDFEKDFFKLMNNSVFGKTMENMRNRIEFSLVSTPEELDKMKRLKKVTIFDENLVGCHKAKYSVALNKPIYIGQNVLDDSKLLMNNFHYNFMKKKIKHENLKLLMTDTDSLCYEIKHQDIFKIMKDNSFEFDLSNFKNDMYDGTNKKVIGKFKDESAVSPIIEFVGLRSKVYSTIDDDGVNSKKNKGIKKSVMKKMVTHSHYKECLNTGVDKYTTQNTFRTHKHTIYIITQKKKCLSRSDDKVYIMSNGIDTRTHGHYKN